jgi:NTP pyrophosphatase (non-canonical NTP hydrolase)
MTESEKQILLIAQEECAEVTQAISKVFRFGIDAEYNDRTNKQRLTEEVGDLFCMIKLMIEKGIVDDMSVHKASIQKRIKLEKWSNVFDEDKDTVN